MKAVFTEACKVILCWTLCNPSCYSKCSLAVVLSGKQGWMLVWTVGSSAQVPHPSPWGSGAEDSGESLTQFYLCLELNFVGPQKTYVCFSRVWADLTDLVRAHLWFSLLCNLWLVNIKAAVLIFSSHIVFVYFSHKLSAEKEKQVCYFQSYSAPTTGQGGGSLAHRPRRGEQHISSKNQLTVLNSFFGGSTCFDNENLSW